MEAISNDLNMPQALGITWEMARDQLLSQEIKNTLFTSFNSILAITNNDKTPENDTIPEHITNQANLRNTLRLEGNYDKADTIRNEIKKMGYDIVDTGNEYKITRSQ